MNLFCFTLDGSSESIYEPPYSPALKDIQPKYQCSPLPLRSRLEWGGSDPSIHLEQPQNGSKAKRNSRRLCVSTKAVNSQTADKHINQACWMLPCDRRDFLQRSNHHQAKGQNRETSKTPKLCGALNSDGRRAAQSSQGADTRQSMCLTRRLMNLKMQTKGELQGAAAERMEAHHDPQPLTLRNGSPLFTCIRREPTTEEPFSGVPSPHQKQQAKDTNEDGGADDIWQPQLGHYRWGPFECSQPRTPFYHTCQQPAHDSWVCGRTSTLSGPTEWDRFEVLIQELEGKHSDPMPKPAPTDLPPGSTSPTRHDAYDTFGRRSPSTRPCDGGGSLKRHEGHLSVQTREESRASGGSDPIKASSPTTVAPVPHRKTPTSEPEKGEAADGRRRLSMNSLESLYSLASRQSSSSGVTSSSDYFSNRDSLRLDDDIFAKQYCGRARVHTDFVPSPYDTESLSLKVGDVIDIIAKPTMGIWTGKLRDKIGNFKFIYVDVLSEECPDPCHEPYSVRQKSTVREVLKRLSLEEYSSSLQLYGYQTVDDLMRLRERHLMELNVTDPEHRHRLLAAVRSLQQLRSGDESEANQEATVPSKSSSGSTRDSGCHMPSDSSPEDGDLDLVSQCSSPAGVTVT